MSSSLLERYRDLELVRRRLDAEAALLLAEIDRSDAFAVDGHRTPQAFVRAVTRSSGADAGHRVRIARALSRLPLVADAAAAGDIPAEHLRMLGSVAANPRLGDALDGADAFFAQHAATMTADGFRTLTSQWERLADTDGAKPTNTENRAFGIRQLFNGWFRVTGMLPPLAGAEAAAILARFEDDEFHADWAAARAEHGDDARAEHSARTPTQRRADAASAIFARAACAPPGEGAVPVVNIVADHDTLLAGLADLVGAHREPTDPVRAASMICRTLDGHPLPAADVAWAAVTGLVRKVIVDEAGTVINLGRRRRLFTGSARDAAVLQAAIDTTCDGTCRWPGCGISLTRSQVDHRIRYADGGPTNPGNAQILCLAHNLLKELGFTPARAPDGTWTYLRTDGTPITPPI